MPELSAHSESGKRHDLLLAHDFPPMGGGISRWMGELARRYPPGSLRISTGLLPGHDEIDATFPNPVDRIPISTYRLKTLTGRIRWARRVATLARDPVARFAWCDSIRPAAYAVRWASRRTGLPYGVMVHGRDLMQVRTRTRQSWRRRNRYSRLFASAQSLVANSEWTARLCRDLLVELHLDHVAARVRVVPLGADPAQFRPDSAAGEAFRHRRHLNDGPLLLTVARLAPHKAIDATIRVVAALASRHPALQYIAVGRGREAAALRALSETLGVADRVHILSDVGDDELPSAYASADVYVGLTRESDTEVEGFGISFAEAAASGLPVVAARAGGIPDAVADGESGVLVPLDDIAAAAQAVDALLGDPARARAMGAAGRARVERYLNWDRVVDEMRAIAEELGRADR